MTADQWKARLNAIHLAAKNGDEEPLGILCNQLAGTSERIEQLEFELALEVERTQTLAKDLEIAHAAALKVAGPAPLKIEA